MRNLPVDFREMEAEFHLQIDWDKRQQIQRVIYFKRPPAIKLIESPVESQPINDRGLFIPSASNI